MKTDVNSTWLQSPSATKIVGWAFCALILSVFSGFMFMGSVDGERDARLLAAEGVSIAAVVTDKRAAVSFRKHGASTSYRILLAYAPPNSAWIEVTETISKKRYDEVDVGDRMTIWYARSNPRVYEFKPGEMAGSARFGWWFAIAMALGAIAAVVKCWHVSRNAAPHGVSLSSAK